MYRNGHLIKHLFLGRFIVFFNSRIKKIPAKSVSSESKIYEVRGIFDALFITCTGTYGTSSFE